MVGLIISIIRTPTNRSPNLQKSPHRALVPLALGNEDLHRPDSPGNCGSNFWGSKLWPKVGLVYIL